MGALAIIPSIVSRPLRRARCQGGFSLRPSTGVGLPDAPASMFRRGFIEAVFGAAVQEPEEADPSSLPPAWRTRTSPAANSSRSFP